jgi:LacI family transcriptional regulator
MRNVTQDYAGPARFGENDKREDGTIADCWDSLRHMTNRSDRRTIAFCSLAQSETGDRRLAGILRYLEEAGKFILRDYRFLPDDVDTDRDAAPPAWTGKVDGVVLFAHIAGVLEDGVCWLKRGGAPVVSLVNEWRHPDIPVVATDSKAVMQMAADYFVKRGFQQIAFVADTISPADTARRRQSFEERLAAHDRQALAYDLPFRSEGHPGEFERMRQDVGLVQLLRTAPKPLAIFAITDNLAHMLCEVCRSLDLDVPGEVAILGCGNLSTSRSSAPPLSTVQTANEQIGYEAMRLLHQMMDGGNTPAKPLLIKPLNVLERTSTLASFGKLGSVHLALTYIQQHACEGLNVNELVNVLSISRSTLEARFAEVVGHPPGQEIHRVRLARAKDLLQKTDLSIGQVATLAGFSDLPPFAKFIRRKLGMSPTEFRRQSRSEAESSADSDE